MQLFRVSDSCIYKYALSSGALSRNCHLLPHCQHRRGYASFADSQPPALITRLNSLCGAGGQSKPLAFPHPDPVAGEPCLRGRVPVPALATTPLPRPCPLGWRSGRRELAGVPTTVLLGALSAAESFSYCHRGPCLLVPRGLGESSVVLALSGSCAPARVWWLGLASTASALPCRESAQHCPGPLPKHRAQSRAPCPFSRRLPPRDAGPGAAGTLARGSLAPGPPGSAGVSSPPSAAAPTQTSCALNLLAYPLLSQSDMIIRTVSFHPGPA